MKALGRKSMAFNSGAAMGAATAFAADGLFIGQPQEFFDLLAELAADADRARREFEHDF
jgi:hypothetical protein